MTLEKLQFALKPDAQAFDEIRLKVVPRFKESELSGDEWRISVNAEFYRKGVLISTKQVGCDMETACGFLFHEFHKQIDNGNAYFAAGIDSCAQEGCDKEPMYLYRINEAYDDRGNRSQSYDGAHRAFCDKHSHRGDQSRGDCDNNYEIIREL